MELIVATRNRGKVAEFAKLFAEYDVVLLPLDAIGLDIEIEETGTSFAENARIKAQTIYTLTGKASVADDSGLCVDALDGRPGIYSARYGGSVLHSDTERCLHLLEELKDVPMDKRTAHFHCAICCVMPDLTIETAGDCHGRILTELRGNGGFGYDPLFLPDTFAESGRSFGELSQNEKNSISHRGEALRSLYEHMIRHGGLERRTGR